MLEARGLQEKAAGVAGSSSWVAGSLLLRLLMSRRGLYGTEVEKMRGVWKVGSKGHCPGQRSLGELGEELEAESQQCGRCGKQELEVNVGIAWGCFVFVCGEGPGK